MNLNEFLVAVLAGFLVLLGHFLLKNFLPGYFNEKGKNQATKEDIGQITNIVEKIKSDLSQQNEFLKAQLSLTNQHKLNVKSAERDALIDYNKRVSAWLYSLVRFTPSNYHLDNYKELKTASADFAKREYECDLAEAHLVLFMHDGEFLELKKNLTIGLIQLEGIIEKSMHKIYGIFSECEFEIAAAQGDLKQQSIARSNMYGKLNPVLDAHREDSANEFKKVHTIHAEMTTLLSTRLKLLEGAS